MTTLEQQLIYYSRLTKLELFDERLLNIVRLHFEQEDRYELKLKTQQLQEEMNNQLDKLRNLMTTLPTNNFDLS